MMKLVRSFAQYSYQAKLRRSAGGQEDCSVEQIKEHKERFCRVFPMLLEHKSLQLPLLSEADRESLCSIVPKHEFVVLQLWVQEIIKKIKV